MTVLVIGGTGRVGREVVRELVAGSGAGGVRVLTRDPQSARVPAGVSVRRGDPADPASVAGALEGVASVFLAFPSVAADHAAADLVELLAARTGHVVYLSAHGVPDDPSPAPPDGGILASHAHVEGLLESCGVPWTALRASGFAANTLGWAEQLRRGDTLRWFGPGITRSLIHEVDLGAVGAAALRDPVTHAGARHHVTGPEALTQREQLAAVGAALGRELRFESLDPDAASVELFGGGEFGRAIVAGQSAMATTPEPVTDTVGRVLGRPARTYSEWARDHVADFRRPDVVSPGPATAT